MSGIKRLRWTEEDVAGLPSGEHDHFERKSGALFETGDYRASIAKELCALANSGGGHLILGVNDAGVFDGVPKLRGKTPFREWLEQVVPGLLSYALTDFRVHEVEPSPESSIPNEKVVVVIDVGDSAFAPHQVETSRIYYYRAGGHSTAAPHFYLETLRNRLANPTLTTSLEEVRTNAAHRWLDGVFVEMSLQFKIENTGRIAAHQWALVLEEYSGIPDGRTQDYKFRFADFPNGRRGRPSGIPLTTTILPSMNRTEERDLGVFVRADPEQKDAIRRELSSLLSPDFSVRFRTVTETSVGRSELISVGNSLAIDDVCQFIANAIG